MRKCYKKGLGRGEGSCGVGVMCQEYEEKKTLLQGLGRGEGGGGVGGEGDEN